MKPYPAQLQLGPTGKSFWANENKRLGLANAD
jgi:hypothetical protein